MHASSRHAGLPRPSRLRFLDIPKEKMERFLAYGLLVGVLVALSAAQAGNMLYLILLSCPPHVVFTALPYCCTLEGPWPTQPSFYPFYPTRRTQVLNGTWSFGVMPAGDDIRIIGYKDIITPNNTEVPSCFDIAAPGIKGPRTTVFYRSSHTCTVGKTSLLKFYAGMTFTPPPTLLIFTIS